MRVRQLKEHYGERLELEWRSFLLRPRPGEQRSLEKFRKYTQSWLKVAADEPSGEFKTWSGDAGPPSHSIPPAVIGKAAAEISDAAFETVHAALLKAYFSESRDIADRDTLQEIWLAAGLDAASFERTRDPALAMAVVDEHNEAIGYGAQGAPSFRMSHHDVAMTGLHPLPTLQRWIDRVLADEV